MPKKKILFIAMEFPYWTLARQMSYGGYMGFEEGFRENDVECITVNSMWLPWIKEICKDEHFDQVWMEITHTQWNESLLAWISELAPIRVGMIHESLVYDPEEYHVNPDLKGRRAIVESRLRYLTHAIAVDENDVETINKNLNMPAMWWPSAVPRRFILEKNFVTPKKQGSFIGNAYYQRALYLKSPELQGLLVKQASPEKGTIHPYLFNALHIITIVFIKSRLPGAKVFLSAYLRCLRRIRQISFTLLLKAFQRNIAVVNLPCLVKAYPGRVIEGMASGRPVVSWEIPDRPKNKQLFEDGKEILLYHDPEQLANHIKRLIANPQLADDIVSNARRKLLQFHTNEKRVKQILDWIETGDLPAYS